ncbi:putative peroxisomal membrane protein Pex17 [Aulographum hederae CBS 113979]|uniref:Putative peroxisomal membrane protein Pex17 n=1 Tax=Aulographum hederae CBS 113979 TaxID=1176131 RepID=A0A6G1GQJ9_9PEZI|nr:putative peroxisomal membrane protein Pex17 [Aulographum hederae CBS 113979]
MPADRLLGILLRSLQTYTEHQDTPRLLSTAASLLTTLTNPLNVTLLTVQLLTAPALWDRPDGLRTCLSFLSVFHSASLTILNREREAHDPKNPQPVPSAASPTVISKDEWTRAIVKAADERSQRWKHLLVLGGLLLGFESPDVEPLTGPLRRTLGSAFVQATNLALVEARAGDELGGSCVTLVLNHVFGSLTDAERAELEYDLLLPVLIKSAYFSTEGLQSAYFLGAIDLDVVEVPGGKFNWPAASPSFVQVERMLQRPLMSSLGPLSRLVSHTLECVKDSWLVQAMIDDLTSFHRSLLVQWRQTKLSEIDPSEESVFLHEDTVRTTLPTLWKVLKSGLFATVIILRGAMGRVVSDGTLAADGVAPVLAMQTLHILRNLYFLSSRLGATSFSQYTFVYLSALDIMSQYPIQADAFLKEIRPAQLGQIPKHPLDRCLNLYFLNTAEHFTLILPPQASEQLLVAAATPYLATGGNNNLLPIFEAAHSVMLAVFSAPQSAGVAAKHLPFYVDALFYSFPQNLSPRQFRLAFKTLLQVTAPPSPLSGSQPDLPATLLELIHHRAMIAPTTPLAIKGIPNTPPESDNSSQLSEQTVLILTLLDGLPFLPLDLLEEWLPLSAELINVIPDGEMRESCKRRFWEILISGEMDPDRSQVCVSWWATRGGREMVLFGSAQEAYMSGALPVESSNNNNDIESKL